MFMNKDEDTVVTLPGEVNMAPSGDMMVSNDSESSVGEVGGGTILRY
jgi:hypothetical protein